MWVVPIGVVCVVGGWRRRDVPRQRPLSSGITAASSVHGVAHLRAASPAAVGPRRDRLGAAEAIGARAATHTAARRRRSAWRAGGLSGLLGVGGGIVMVPLFTEWLSMTMKPADRDIARVRRRVRHPRHDHPRALGTSTGRLRRSPRPWASCPGARIGRADRASTTGSQHGATDLASAVIYADGGDRRPLPWQLRSPLRCTRTRAAHCAAVRASQPRARAKTASNIGSVSLPVKVFCWLGW